MMMLTDVCRLTALWLLIGATTASAREPEKKPRTISTEPKLLVAVLKTAEGKTIRINGEAVFTPDVANSDDTMSGKLTYAISSDSRLAVARAVNKPLSEIPEDVAVTDVTGIFEKNASCPNLQFEFLAMDLGIAETKARLNRFKLTFRETSQELSKLLCVWAKRINIGRGGSPVRAVNRLLKGEKIE